jgi:adenylate cyclase
MASGGVETERKFLVCGRGWERLGTAEEISQGYLNDDIHRTVRVRIKGEKAFFTVKGETIGDTKTEIECEIPIDKAREIMKHPSKLCIGYPIEKIRRTVVLKDLTWEIDEFYGENRGLVVAEVEYPGQEVSLEEWRKRVDEDRPSWVGTEITNVFRYYNSNLAEKPFDLWNDEEKTEMTTLAKE